MSLLAAMLMAAEAFSAPLSLPKPARIDMTVERTREDVRGGQTQSASSFTRYEKTIEPRGETYRVTLKPVETKLPQLASANEQAKLQAAVEGLTNRTYVYAADEDLAPTAMEDWPGAVAEIRKALIALDSSAEKARSLDLVTGMFERMTPEQAAMTILKEDTFLTIAVNVALEPGKTTTYEDQLPNPLGGPPIKANGALALERVDRDRGVAILRWSLALDPESTRESLAHSAKAMMAALDPKADAPKPAFDKTKLERTSGCLYEVALKSGLPVKADCDAKITVSDPTGQTATRNERWVITQTLKN